VNEYITIARISKSHGIEGELKAKILSDNPKRFNRLKQCYVQFDDGSYKSFEIAESRVSGEYWNFKFKGFDTPESVEVFSSRDVFILRQNVQPLPEGHYYPFDLEGCQVSENGVVLGTVTELLMHAGNDVLYIERSDDAGKKKEPIMIPMAKQFVKAIDIAAKTIDVITIPGMVPNDED